MYTQLYVSDEEKSGLVRAFCGTEHIEAAVQARITALAIASSSSDNNVDKLLQAFAELRQALST